jgi:methylated-DNA-protein-cysteine methyltransferase-like protein
MDRRRTARQGRQLWPDREPRGLPAACPHVGAILRDLPEGTRLPWHRILRSTGELAFAPGSESWTRQLRLLAAEGIALEQGRVQMALHQWQP